MKYYIYEIDTHRVIDIVETNDPESFAFDYDWDTVGATLTPAFGCVDGLIN